MSCKNKLWCLLSLTLLIMPLAAAGKKTKQVIVSDELLSAICMVESGCNPEVKDGDNGNARGQFQIHRSYWQDSVDFDKTIGGSYENVSDKEYAKKIVRAYMLRYAPDNATNEQIARVHNAGPKALTKNRIRLTDSYWAKVKKHLN